MRPRVPDGRSHRFVGALFTVPPGRERDLLDLLDLLDDADALSSLSAPAAPLTGPELIERLDLPAT